MSSLMYMLILNCEKATQLAIKKEEGKVSAIDQVRLWIHAKVCNLCKEFESQNTFININMKSHYAEGCQEKKLSDSKKKEMKEAILQEAKQVL